MDNDLSYLESLPFELFLNSILESSLTAKELKSLCHSSTNIQKKCQRNNYELYRRLILRDYGLNITPSNSEDHFTFVPKRNPKDYYFFLNEHDDAALIHLNHSYYQGKSDRVRKDLLRLWARNLEKIEAIFEDEFPNLPTWVIYNEFKKYQLGQMSETFIDTIDDELPLPNEIVLERYYSGGFADVNFAFTMLPLIGASVEGASQNFWDEVKEQGPEIRIDLLM